MKAVSVFGKSDTIRLRPDSRDAIYNTLRDSMVNKSGSEKSGDTILAKVACGFSIIAENDLETAKISKELTISDKQDIKEQKRTIEAIVHI